MYLLYF